MSGRLLRLVCTVAVTASVVLAPGRAAAEPAPGERPLPELLTDLSELYRGAERATETYNATAERLTRQRAESRRLDERLAKARRSLDDGRGAAGGSPGSSTRASPASPPTYGCCSPAIPSGCSTRATSSAGWPASGPRR